MKVGDLVRKVPKRGHPLTKPIGRIIEFHTLPLPGVDANVTGKQWARIQAKSITVSWPVSLLEVVNESVP